MTQADSATQIERRVVLQASGNQPPLFVFPGIRGTPDTFAALAARLGPERPVFGFQLIGAQEECEPVRQVSRLAQLYAAEVRSAQPRGPYFLFGYSFGGAVAFEVSRELLAQGERVGLVIMVDCPAPGYPKPAPALVRLKTHAQNLLAQSMPERLAYLRERLQNVGRRFERLIGKSPRDPEDERSPEPLHLQRVDEALYEAYRDYVPAPLNVDVLFMTADTPPDWPTANFDDPLLGWGDALRGRISQCAVPGAHLDIFAPQHLDALARRLRAALHQAERLAQPARDAVGMA